MNGGWINGQGGSFLTKGMAVENIPVQIVSLTVPEAARKLLTVKQAAKIANVCLSSLYAAIATGMLSCYRLRIRPGSRGTLRIAIEQLEAWLQGGKVEAKAEGIASPPPRQPQK